MLRLDDPVDAFLPELADRRVLRDPAGPLDDTVPAARPISVRDVLTFRLGLGMDMEHWDRPQPVLERAAELGLGAGPPAPQQAPATEEWIRRLGSLPLSYQPGERWLYHVGADVAGVLVERAAGRPFPDVLRERIFEPLGMTDTAFHVPPAKLDRFGPLTAVDPASGALGTYDPADGQWSTPPAFPGGGAGLVSTVDDYLAFAAHAAGRRHRPRAAHPVAGDRRGDGGRARRAGARSRRRARLGPRAGRAPPAGGHRARPPGPTAGTAVSARRGRTIPPTGWRACCSRTGRGRRRPRRP